MTGSADQPTTTTPASETNTNTNTSNNSSDPAQPRQAPDQQQDGSDQQLSSLCSSLQVTAAAANDGLRDLLVSAPLTRQSIVKLSQELVEIQTAARLYIRHSSVAEAAPGSDADIARGGDPSIPRPVLEDVTKLVRCTLDLLSEVMDTLDSSSQQGSNGASRRQLAGHAEAILPRLVDLTTPAQLARTALNLGLDAMAFGPAPSQGDEGPELPAYQSTQLLDDSLRLRMRLTNLDSNEDNQSPHLRPIIAEFLDHLQNHIGRSASSLAIPALNGNPDGALPSDVSSMHSEAIRGSGLLAVPENGPSQANTPVYDAINNNYPAPLDITVKHMLKRDVTLNEIVELHFLRRQGRQAVSACTMDNQTRYFDIANVSVVNSVAQHGFNLTYPSMGTAPISSNLWAYVADDDTHSSTPYNPWQTSAYTFSKPMIIIGDHITGRKHHKLRWAGARPLCFSRDGDHLAVTGLNHRIGLIKTANNASIVRTPVITSHTDTVTHALFTPDSHALVSISHDATIRLTDPTNLEPLAKLDTGTHKKPVLLGVTPDSNVIVSVWGDMVYRWNHTTGGVDSYALGSRRSREGWPMALSSDCRLLACRTMDGVDISDAHSGNVLFTIRFQSGFVTAAAFSEDGRYLALGKAVANAGLKVCKSTLDVWEIVF